MSTDPRTTPDDGTPNDENGAPDEKPTTGAPDADAPSDDGAPPADETTEDGTPMTDEDEGTTFDREYVQRLRSESAGHRKRAREAEATIDGLRRELWTHHVRETGLLADPEDLPYNPEAAGDPEAVKAAAEALIARKPHMRRTGTSGPLPEAATRTPSAGGVSWSSLLRSGA